MERTLHMVASDEAIAELGVALGAQVVDGVNAIFEFEERNVLPLGRSANLRPSGVGTMWARRTTWCPRR
jgi:hypothetical protein